MVSCSHEMKRCFLLGRKVRTNLESILKSRDITLPRKVHLVKAMFFSSSHLWMWELDHKKAEHKNWCFWIVVLEKTLESPLDCKEIKPVSPKGNQTWIFIGRTDAEAETPILGPPVAESWLIRKRPWCCEKLKAGGEGDDRAWDGWMTSLTQWTWVWTSSKRWWRTGMPGMLQFMGSERAGHDWVTEQQQHMFGYGPSMLKACVLALSLSPCLSFLLSLSLSLSVSHPHTHPLVEKAKYKY